MSVAALVSVLTLAFTSFTQGHASFSRAVERCASRQEAQARVGEARTRWCESQDQGRKAARERRRRYESSFDRAVMVSDASRRHVVLDWWCRLPLTWCERFADDGWQMVVTSGDWGVEAYDGEVSHVLGLTYPDDHVIVMEDTDRALSHAFAHEFGHFIDTELGMVSESAEFRSIWEREASSFVIVNRLDDHDTSDPTEFFAEVFCQGLLYERSCRESAPEAFDFVFSRL